MKEILQGISAWNLKIAFRDTEKEVIGHPDIVSRLYRAYKILTEFEGYIIDAHWSMPISFTIYSPNGAYLVTPSAQSCTCPDNEKLCKHRLAVRMILKALEMEKEEIVKQKSCK
jgi:hypothetical protein